MPVTLAGRDPDRLQEAHGRRQRLARLALPRARPGTGQETPLAETRSVDDQLEWLDDSTLLYGSPDSAHAVFSVSADGTGEPHRFLDQALSPAVLHAPLPEASLAGLADGPRLTVPSTDLHTAATAPVTAPPGAPVTHRLL